MLSLLLLTAQPILKAGPCPIGYYSYSSYCVPASPASPKLIQGGTSKCPLGWYSSNSYCVKVR